MCTRAGSDPDFERHPDRGQDGVTEEERDAQGQQREQRAEGKSGTQRRQKISVNTK